MDPPERQIKPPDLRRASSASPEKACYSRPLHTRTSSSAAATSKKVDHGYILGDAARPSDVNIFQSVDEHVAAVQQLSKGGHCFILRSDFSFTYALVIKHEVGGMLEVQVTEEGGTKSIPRDHWGKYIRTLNKGDSPYTTYPAGGHLDEKRRHREGQHQSKKVGSHPHHGRRSTVGHERPSRHSNPVTFTGSKTPVSKKEGAPVSFRRSAPNLDEEGHYKISHSEYIRLRRNLSPSGSDESPGVDDAIESPTLPKLPFTKGYGRSMSQDDVPIKKQATRSSTRRVTVSDKPLSYMPSIPTKEFKRSVSIQGGDVPLKKCLKNGYHKRSQSETGQQRQHESPESCDSSSSSLDSSLSLDSIDDSSLRAQEDLNKLLSKSMPSLKQGLRREKSLRGAFGDVTEIEILD